jgi:alkylated DNA repair protein alkB family protein 6
MSLQLTTMPACLEDVRIKCLPRSAYYIANFIREDEEKLLLNKIETAPKPRWKQLSKRRLQTWPSNLTNNTLLESPLPKWLTEPVISRITSCPLSSTTQNHIFSDSPHGLPNHVLINEYLQGQGIMPHKDGSAYHPVVCTVSLGAPLCLEIYATREDGTRETEARWRIFQEPRSLLITTGELYTDFLHGIADTTEDVNLAPSTVANWDLLGAPQTILDGRSERRTRISLTYRDVLKVSRLGGKFGIFGKP